MRTYKYKVYPYGPYHKKIIQNTFQDLQHAHPTWNLLSYLKKYAIFTFSSPLSYGDVTHLSYLSPFLDTLEPEFNFAIYGKEDKYTKLTMVFKNKKKVKKVLFFASPIELTAYFDRTSNLQKKLQDQLDSANHSSISYLLPTLEQASSHILTLTTPYYPLKPLSILHLMKRKNRKLIQGYLENLIKASKQAKGHPCIAHGDCKLNNMGIYKEHLYIYDFEQAALKEPFYDICFFLQDLKEKARKNLSLLPLYQSLSKRFKKFYH